MNNETADLMNDLMMLIENQENMSETYFNSEYKRITDRITEIGDVK